MAKKDKLIMRLYRVTPAQDKKVKVLSKKSKISESELVRRSIELYDVKNFAGYFPHDY